MVMWFVNSCCLASCSTTNLSCKLVVLCSQPARRKEKIHRLLSSARKTSKLQLVPGNFYSSPLAWNTTSRISQSPVQTPSTSPTDRPTSQSTIPPTTAHPNPMDSKLIDVWQASAGNPFLPTVGKGTQFLVAFVLLLLGLFSFGIFALSKKPALLIAYLRAVPKLTNVSSRPFCSQRPRHWYSSFCGHRVCLPAPPLLFVR